MRRPASSAEYREISNQIRAHHEVGPKEETGMGKDTTVIGGLTIGLDLGDKHTVGCVLTDSGEVEETFRVATTMSALGRTMA